MQNNRSASLIKSSLSITAVLLVCKTLSFVRDMLLANYLGASELSDVFLASSGVLFLFTSFILSPFSVAYLPIATEHYLRDPEQGRSSFLGKIYGAAFSLGMIFLLVMLLFLRPLVELMVPGFSPEAKEQLANMLLFQLPAVLFVMLSGVVGGNLRLLGRLNLAGVFQRRDRAGVCALSAAVPPSYHSGGPRPEHGRRLRRVTFAVRGCGCSRRDPAAPAQVLP